MVTFVIAAWCSVKMSDQRRVAPLVCIWVTLLRNMTNLNTRYTIQATVSMKDTYMIEMGSMKAKMTRKMT